MGSFVTREIMKGEIPGIRLVAAADIRPPSPDLLQGLREHSVSLVQSFESLGRFPIRLANWPNPDNPKTSLLSCLSVVSLLKRIRGTVQIGG
jgi:hypothetical protein